MIGFEIPRRRNTETAVCLDCLGPFERFRRKGLAVSGLALRCPKCRPAHKSILQKATRARIRAAVAARAESIEREREYDRRRKRESARLYRLAHPLPINSGQCDRSRANCARRIASMNVGLCVKCGGEFPVSKGAACHPELCCLCALDGGFALPRTTIDHPLVALAEAW